MKAKGRTKPTATQAPKPVPSKPAGSLLTVRRAEARVVLGGLAERTFARLESEGILVPATRGRGGRPSTYDLRRIVPAYLTYVTAARPTTDRDARAHRDQTQAALNELRLAQASAALVSADQVVLAGQAYTKAWTAQVRGLPRRLVQAGLIPREQEAGVMGLCREVLAEIAGWRSVADASKAREAAA